MSRTDTTPLVTEAEVRERLRRVTDPELDESIVELDYVDEIRIDSSHVHVEFTLPTAWCSPAFAWMMATDARDETEALAGVDRTTIRLREHLHEAEITDGVSERRAFGEVFPDADGGVSEVRATLDEKARIARQYDAVESLLAAGLTPEQIVSLRPTDCDTDGDDPDTVLLADDAFGVTLEGDALSRYLEKARATGLLADDHPELFRTPEEDPIPLERFELVHRRGRLATVNMSGQGSVCDALNRSRRDDDRPPLSEWDGGADNESEAD